MQKYGCSPTTVGDHSNELPAIAKLESNTAPTESASEDIPDVNVCAALSVFEKITLPPTSTVAVLGIKHPSGVSSHPGAPEPAAGSIVTSAWSAKTSWVILVKEIIEKSNKIEHITKTFMNTRRFY